MITLALLKPARLAKLDMHQGLKVMHIYFKFHEIPVSGFFVMAYFIDLKPIQGQELLH